ncbi:MAG: metallophosphoesterase, partial [Oscillospiraceae bacterium]|nr:metallophosphoesterase [Oscillospiraceae bacterium]
GTYTYSLKLTDAPLNTAASEAAYGDETLKLIYFNSVGRSFKISDLGYVDGTSVPTAPRGEAFVAGEDKDILLDNKEALAQISFEYKLTDGQQFNIGLMPDWSNFFGYFSFNAEGNVYAYDGVTTQKLSDGYIRVTLDMAALTKYSGNPSTAIDFLFIRGAWSDANGYIDNVCFLTESEMEQGGNDSGYTEIVTPGGSFGANEGITINFEPGAYDIVTFDYTITNGGTMDICLMDASWSKYYGYFNFGVAGANYEYDGLSYESLDNGYIRVTLNVSELNKTNLENNRDNAPETVGVLFVRDDWSSAAGSIDNVRLLTKVSGGTEPENPEEPETPVNVNISYEFSGNEANRAGYAEGVVTLSGGDSRELYEMYWCNASGKLTGYKALATLTGANKTLTIGENVMIPAGADRLCAYVGDQLVASYMLESKAYNSQIKTKFAVLSDVHTNYPTGETYLRTVLKKLEAEGVQYVIVTGDIAETANDWSKYVSAVEDSGFTGIMMAAGGNHDLAPEARVELRKHAIYDGHAGAWVSMAQAPAYFASTYAGDLKVTAEYTDYEGNGETMYYLVAIEDNAIIFMSQDNRNCTYTNHEDNFSKAQLNFVEDALYRYSKTHNVLIAQHADVEQLVVNPSDGGSMQAYETFPNVMRFVNLLKQYPEAIWMSGHTHSPFASGVQFTDKLYVNGVITNTALARSFGCSATGSSQFTGGSEGYVCYQYENDIVYEARTFKENGTDGNRESSFVNLTMPQYSYIIPVMIGNSHGQPILPENLVAT